jgi:hypothetical protein
MEITYKKFIAMVLATVSIIVVFYGTFALVFYPTDENDFLFSERYIEMFTGQKPAAGGNGSTITITGDVDGESAQPVELVRACIRGDMVRILFGILVLKIFTYFFPLLDTPFLQGMGLSKVRVDVDLLHAAPHLRVAHLRVHRREHGHGSIF